MREFSLDTTINMSVKSQVNTLEGAQGYSRLITGAQASSKDDIRKSKVSLGFRPPLPYKASGRTVGYGLAAIDSELRIGAELHKSSCLGETANRWGTYQASLYADVIPQSSKDRLIIQLLNDVGAQKWSAGQMLAEMQGVVDSIGGKARQLQAALMHASRKEWRHVARVLGVKPAKLGSHAKDAASGWLAYHFGWSPIVEDMAQSMLWLGGYTKRDALIIMARGSIKEQATYNVGQGNFFVSSAVVPGISHVAYNYGTVFDTQNRSEEEYRASLYYEPDMAYLRELTKHGIIGVSTPWAIVPWSFLLDWIVPVGDYLAAVDATVGLRFKGGSETLFKRCTGQRKDVGFYIDNQRPNVRTSGQVHWFPATSWSMVRGVFKSSPLPFPAYVKNPLSLWRATTSIALLKQVKFP